MNNSDRLEQAMNPQQMPVQAQEVGIASVTERARTEIQGMMTVAKHFPRDEIAAHRKAVKTFEMISAAEGAQYSYPRGKSTIKGPSVSLAREAARCYGNLRWGVDVVSETKDKIHLRGFCHDLESNSMTQSEDCFEKLIQRSEWVGGAKSTKWVRPDERDLRELVNRRGAFLERNAILKMLPDWLIKDCCEVADKTLRAASSGSLTKNRDETLRDLVSAFEELGVSKEMIEEKLGHELKLIDAAGLSRLKTTYKSIRDGNSTRDEEFKMPTKGSEEPKIETKGAKKK